MEDGSMLQRKDDSTLVEKNVMGLVVRLLIYHLVPKHSV
jgi:hypothetical protein